jgi:hypothetical protein
MQLTNKWQVLLLLLGVTVCPVSALAETFQTDQDGYPRNFPATYNQTLNKVLDLTSDPNLPPLFELRDLVIFRQYNAFRTIMRDMFDMQTLSDYTIRTRDLPTAYCTSLLAEGFDQCRPIVVQEPPVAPPPEPPVAPPPPPPVPALW